MSKYLLVKYLNSFNVTSIYTTGTIKRLWRFSFRNLLSNSELIKDPLQDIIRIGRADDEPQAVQCAPKIDGNEIR